MEEQRRRFWQEIADYKGQDPLEVWLRFVKWTQDTFKAGGSKSELLPLLERCTRELQGVERYRDDARYLRVWIQYADCLPEPRDEHDIGQGFSLYYIAHAAYLEIRGSYARADAVLQEGVRRLAHPVDRMRAKYQEFQQRMARRLQRKLAEGGSLGLDDGEAPPAARAALQMLQAPKGRRRAPSGNANPPPCQAQGASAARPKRKADAGGVASKENEGGLEIYVDDEFRAGGGDANPAVDEEDAGARRGEGGQPGWAHLGTFEQTRKENVQQPMTWAGAKLKQKAALVAAPAPALDVLEDAELVDAPVPVPGPAPAGTLRRRLDGGALQEGLLHDPLRLHKVGEPLAERPGALGAPAASPAAPAAKRKKEEVFAWDMRLLSAAGGEELSFEEARAKQWLATRSPAAPDEGSNPGSPAAAADMDCSPALPPPALQPPTAAGDAGGCGGAAAGVRPGHVLDQHAAAPAAATPENMSPDPVAEDNNAPTVAREAAPGVLRDIAGETAAAMGITVGDGDDVGSPLRRLRLAGSEQQEDFQVYCPLGTPGAANGTPGRPDAVVMDPFDPVLQASLLAGLEPPLSQWDGVCACGDVEFAAAAAALRRGAARGGGAVQLGPLRLRVQASLGQGGFASVFQVQLVADGDGDGPQRALKLDASEHASGAWEFYALRALAGRAGPDSRGLFAAPEVLVLGTRGSALLLPLGAHGTLQALLNAHLAVGQRMSEALALHYAAEALRCVGALHGCAMLHCDIKPDNFLLAPRGRLQLIDFGRAVDLALLPADAQFLGDSQTEAFRCREMAEGRVWRFQADAFALAGTLHCLLFGEYMEVECAVDSTGAERVRLRHAFRRYWATELWGEVFDSLLNPTDKGAPPPCALLLQHISEHLAANPALQQRAQAELTRQGCR
ncbi:hypothetical protein WJX81_007865 [Elliptochloris bilobata]|uniref:Uncharacterized protein n=1 Tax=Elliptochloris bilobata TaxID=381761 RepID=A0AAW1QMI7_9CHLO